MSENKIILVGKAGAGKNYLMEKLAERGFKPFVSCTTRPKRTNEIDGKDYNFYNEQDFVKLIKLGRFWEHKSFNGWRYGTLQTEWDDKQVFIFTPSGVADISPEERKKCFIIYLDVPLEIRKERLAKRSDADSVDRRIAADEKDFKDFINFDIRITNPNF